MNILNDPADMESAFDSGKEEGAAAERAAIVAMLDEWIAELAKQDMGEANFLWQFRNRIARSEHRGGGT